MVQATFNGTVIADSDQTVMVDGNHYFPAASLVQEHYSPTNHTTVCGWKGTASYYTITVGDKVAANGAWYYPATKEGAKNIEGYVAFYTTKGITVA